MMLDVLPNLLINNNGNKGQNMLNPPINPLISTPPPPLQQPSPITTTAVSKSLNNVTTPPMPLVNLNGSTNGLNTITTGGATVNPSGAQGLSNPAIAIAAAARIPPGPKFSSPNFFLRATPKTAYS